jgi:hypothetical protein
MWYNQEEYKKIWQMGEVRNAYNILFRKCEWKGQVGGPRVNVRIIFKWILQKYVVCGQDISGSG